ncbi:MAG: DUF4956 domain-containing protein [Lachnospiraceae bacterium]|nr:DUF4956 domain-containing protein [Lachnospiraceae bacterium]
MSKDEILSYFYTNSTNYGVKRTLIILMCGLITGMIIYLTYYITSEKIVYNRKFNWSLVTMLLITVIVMMMISSNIAVSLGMVGALSIVRFRTAVKDSRDTMFIFWAMAEGLCVSSQNYRLTFTSVLFIAIVLIISSKIPGVWNRYLLIVTGEGEPIDRAEFQAKLSPFVVSQKLRTANKDSAHEELILEIKTRGELNLDVIDELSSVSGIRSVNWVAESGETVG